MQKIIWYCDGCNAKMANEEYTASLIVARDWLVANNGAGSIEEVFCKSCLEHAQSFWDAKIKLLQELVTDNVKRLQNQRQNFFKEIVLRRRMKVLPREAVQ